jgi:hypothetical protein
MPCIAALFSFPRAQHIPESSTETHLEFELLVGFGNLEDGEEAKEVGQDEANMTSNQHRYLRIGDPFWRAAL